MPTTISGMGAVLTPIITDLTLAFVPVVVETHSAQAAVIYVDYVDGDETDVDVRVETSEDDGVTWRIVNYSSTSVFLTFSNADAAKRFLVRDLGKFETKMRVAIIANDGTPTGTVSISVMLKSSRQPVGGNVTSVS
jgi:hypothetical protein